METRYTKSVDGTSIAYNVQDGPSANTPILFVPGAISNLMVMDLNPAAARFSERIARFAPVIRFDKRGAGLSDRTVQTATVEEQVADIEAVRAAAGAERVVLSGLSQGAAVSILYAQQYPARVTHLILNQGICCDALDPAAPPEERRPLVDWNEFFGDLENDFAGFSTRMAEIMCPSGTREEIDNMAAFLRVSVSPQNLRALWQGIVDLDLRPRLADVDIPTLVTHSRGDRHHPVAHGRYMAEHIPGARYLELDSDLHVPASDSRIGDQISTAIEEFITGDVRHTADRRFAAIVFVDIVASTKQQRDHGDELWRGKIGAWEGAMRRVAEQFAGRIVKFQGDGIMAAFSSAGDALRAAHAALSATAALGLDSRAGVHAGEAYEVDGDLYGTCVNIAARACDQAGNGQILTTAVVEGLVEGSEIRFDAIGEVELKGVGARRLLRMARSAPR